MPVVYTQISFPVDPTRTLCSSQRSIKIDRLHGKVALKKNRIAVSILAPRSSNRFILIIVEKHAFSGSLPL